jgi:uncharacterized protein YkwD
VPLGITLRTTVVALAALLALAVGHAGARPVAELAPAGSCGTAADLEAREAAVLCFVNWARRVHGLEPLARSELLVRAAADKARAIVRCGEFSHSPCGAASTAAVSGAGYRYRMWGETLYSDDGAGNTPRAAVRAWLESPPHRAALLEGAFREAGSVQVMHHDPDFPEPAGVWVLELGRR